MEQKQAVQGQGDGTDPAVTKAGASLKALREEAATQFGENTADFLLIMSGLAALGRDSLKTLVQPLPDNPVIKMVAYRAGVDAYAQITADLVINHALTTSRDLDTFKLYVRDFLTRAREVIEQGLEEQRARAANDEGKVIILSDNAN